MTKIDLLFWLLGIVLSVMLVIYGPQIYDKFWGYKGIAINPTVIHYNCEDGLTKAISIINYDSKLRENLVVSIKWPINKSLDPKLGDLEGSFRNVIESMTSSTNESYYRSYIVASIKPKTTIQFDLVLNSDCKEPFDIYIVQDEPFTIEARTT